MRSAEQAELKKKALPIYSIYQEIFTINNQINYFHYFNFLSVIPLNIKKSNLHLNPAISKLKFKLESFFNSTALVNNPKEKGFAEECNNININPFLHSYAKSILSFSLDDIASKYGKNLDLPIAKYTLPNE